MVYLFLETWVFILLAGLLGLFIGWLIWGSRGEGKYTQEDFSKINQELDHCKTRCAELEANQQGNTPDESLAKPGSIVAGDQASGSAREGVDSGETETTNVAEVIGEELPNSQVDEPVDKSDSDAEALDLDDETIEDDWRPEMLTAPVGSADNLKRIKGIGPVIEKTLNELGIYHFRQIAAFTEHNIKWVDNYISFPGRIQREQWVVQAQQLAEGGSTEFSDRYDKNAS